MSTNFKMAAKTQARMLEWGGKALRYGGTTLVGLATPVAMFHSARGIDHDAEPGHYLPGMVGITRQDANTGAVSYLLRPSVARHDIQATIDHLENGHTWRGAPLVRPGSPSDTQLKAAQHLLVEAAHERGAAVYDTLGNSADRTNHAIEQITDSENPSFATGARDVSTLPLELLTGFGLAGGAVAGAGRLESAAKRLRTKQD